MIGNSHTLDPTLLALIFNTSFFAMPTLLGGLTAGAAFSYIKKDLLIRKGTLAIHTLVALFCRVLIRTAQVECQLAKSCTVM